MRLPTLLLSLLLATPVVAQTQTRIFLGGDSNAAKGGANTFPWSRQELRYQVIFPAAQFQKKAWMINDILAAPQLSMTPTRRTAVYHDIEIRIGQTAQATLTSNWKTNNPNPVVVHRGPLRCDFEVGKWRGLGITKPFRYIPLPKTPNVCVEFIIWKLDPGSVSIRAVTGSSQRAYYYKWTTSQTTSASLSSGAAKMGLVLNSGNWVEAGAGCLGSAKNRPTLSSTMWPQVGGKPFVMDLSGGKPASLGIMIAGLKRDKILSIPLPFDLKPLGAPGCLVWNDIWLTTGVGINASGKGKFSLPLPSFLGNERIYFHWWNLDKTANNFGLTTSNLGVVLLGR